MAIEGDLASVLREVIQFLECLREVKLPSALEKIRDNLLIRSKDTLTIFVTIGRSASPGPYLNMSAGSKGLSLAKNESELQEYVGCEDPRSRRQQDYYETFQQVETTSCTTTSLVSIVEHKEEKDRQTENVLANIYAGLSAAQTKSKCHKCGPLYRKEGKKLFVFEQYRMCWVGLVGSHLLIYGTDRDSRPSVMQPIRGYKARPAPNAIPRDQRRSESAFEIFRPGSRTLQFIARTPKDMEQWVAKICETSSADRDELKIDWDAVNGSENELPRAESREDSSTFAEEQYQDVGALLRNGGPSEDASVRPSVDSTMDSASAKNVACENAIPPALPARGLRRLPSLPPNDESSSYGHADEEEDDIYHKIEDLKGSSHYQNLSSEAKSGGNEPEDDLLDYDDVRAAGKERRTHEDMLRERTFDDKQCEKRFERKPWKRSEENSRDKSFERELKERTLEKKARERSLERKLGEKKFEEEQRRESLESEQIYDDVTSAKRTVASSQQEKTASCDDVKNLPPTTKPTKNQSAGKPEDSAKSPQKKSFLDRVRSRRESPRKVEKKSKRKTTSANLEELPTYDDVTGLVTGARTDSGSPEEELPEYNCPPPPRPIYAKPPALSEPVESLEFYDDVSAYRNKELESRSRAEQFQGMPESTKSHNANDASQEESNRCETAKQQDAEEVEHYQTPRNELCQPNHAQTDQQEELYDDIALLVDFTARQRGNLGKREADGARVTSAEKRPWNRFVGGRKLKSTESTSSETNDRFSNGNEEVDDVFHNENPTLIRMNTFQKLISKMENSLGKASARTQAMPMPFNKPNGINNA